MAKILRENDIRKKEDIILINALNRYSRPGEFKKTITYLSEKIGNGDSHVNFYFWDCLDEYSKTLYDAPFDGVEVDYLDDIQQYNLQDVYHYVSLASQRYIELNPNDKDEIEEILDKMKNNFNCE